MTRRVTVTIPLLGCLLWALALGLLLIGLGWLAKQLL